MKYNAEIYSAVMNHLNLAIWGFYRMIEVEEETQIEAEAKAIRRVKEELVRKNQSVDGLLVNSLTDERGNRIQITAWDESGFPI